MDVFELGRRVVDDYQRDITSFVSVRDPLIQKEVDRKLGAGLLWPEPRIGLNPSFETGGLIWLGQGILVTNVDSDVGHFSEPRVSHIMRGPRSVALRGLAAREHGNCVEVDLPADLADEAIARAFQAAPNG